MRDFIYLIPLLVIVAALSPLIFGLLIAVAWRNPATSTAAIIFAASVLYLAIIRFFGG